MGLRRITAALAAVVPLALVPLGDADATAAAPTWTAMQQQFDYVHQPIRVQTLSTHHVTGAVVRSITYRAVGHDPVLAYLVTPTTAGPHPAAMFLHWLDGAADSNRGEFLREAISLAEGPGHAVSLLPQESFPFAYFPVGDVRDRDAAIKQVIQLRRGLDLLDARSDVDPSRIAVIGHDYGAMWGSMLAAVDRSRVHALVVMAADATMANWFVTYLLDLPAEQVGPYTRMLSSVDPVRYLPHDPHRLLLQYATDDIYIPHSVAQRMRRAAGPTATFRDYDTDHALRVPAAQADRDAFIWRALNPAVSALRS
jgi:pimeloyl-ACP methyl ester carboxylesterase